MTARRSARDEPVILPLPPVDDRSDPGADQRDEVEMAADVVARLMDRGIVTSTSPVLTDRLCTFLGLVTADVNAALDRLDQSGWTPPVRAS